MARHLCLPICQTRPRPCVPNLLWGRKQCAGVSDRSAPDGTAVEDRGMAEQAHVEEAAQAEFRAPEPTMNRPTGERERLGRPATPHLHHSNPIPFFRQTQGRNTAPEAGSDHDEIEIKLRVVGLTIGLMAARFHTAPLSRHEDERDLCDHVLAHFDDSVCDRPPQGQCVKWFVFAQSAQNCQLRTQHVSFGARCNDQSRRAFNFLHCA